MPMKRYLAMTASEIGSLPPVSEEIGWMACHFSSWNRGLSNLPQALPPGSLLILDDSTPIHGHDPLLIAAQLTACMEKLGCAGLLLDFQRPGCPETALLVRGLGDGLGWPAAVSAHYAQFTRGAVFIPPCPPQRSIGQHLKPWLGREIWLDLAPAPTAIRLWKRGREITALPELPKEEGIFRQERLHCRYRMELGQEDVRFTLYRNRADLEEMLREGEGLGVATAVGLYQEWRSLE